MKDTFTIPTNLSRSVTLGIIAVMGGIISYFINSNVNTLIILIILIGVFSQYILSKKILRITVYKEQVRFDYLQLTKKTVWFERDIVKIRKRTEVYFRGGKNEVFEIYNEITGKKLFEISKRSFKYKEDHLAFESFFKSKD